MLQQYCIVVSHSPRLHHPNPQSNRALLTRLHDSLYRTRYLHFTSHASFDVELLLSAHVSQILYTSSTFLTSRSFPLPYVHSTPNVGPTLLPLLDYRPVTRSTATPTAKKRSEAKLQALELHRRRPHDHDFTMQPRSRCVTIAS